MASLAEAIALQGVDTETQRLGQQVAATAAKRQYAQGKKASDLNTELNKYIQGVGKFHRAVQPEVKETIGKIITKAEQKKASGNPFWVNEMESDISRLNVSLSELQAKSKTFEAFDLKRKELDKGKIFTTPGYEAFEKDYQTTGDYRSLYKNFKDGKYGQMNNVSFDERGNIIFDFENKIDYEKDVVDAAKNIRPVMAYNQMSSAPFGQIKETDVFVRPLTKEDAAIAYNNNRDLFPQGVPVSIEETVVNYMSNNPSAVRQYMYNNNIPFEEDENGQLKPELREKVKQGMMEIAKGQAYDDVKSRIYKEKGDINIYPNGKIEETANLQGILSKSELSLDASGKNNVYTLGNYNVQTKSDISIPAQSNYFDVDNNELKQPAVNYRIEAIELHPMRTIKGNKRLAKTNEKMVGVGAFYRFTNPGGPDIFAPLESAVYKTQILATGKTDKEYKDVMDFFAKKTKKVNQAIRDGKLERDIDKIYKYLQDN